MKATTKKALLQDHIENGMIAGDDAGQAADRKMILQLDPDHPGFRDRGYRARRNQIAEIASDFKAGSPVPDAPYTDQEHNVWRLIR